MHPYRSSRAPSDRAAERDPEARVIRVLFVAIGAVPVVLALAQHTRFGVEATVGLLMVLAGLVL